MANRLLTVFQALDSAINGKWDKSSSIQPHINSYDVSGNNGADILYKTKDRIDYAKAKLELQQNTYLKDRWVRANMDLSIQAFNGLNNLKLMYRDADLMDQFPEIGAALNILSEEACVIDEHSAVLKIYSKSDRIKSVLEDLFVNRLDIQTMAQMIIRGMCKYGNQFMLLNVDSKNGVMGWRQLPVYNVERLENGIANPYGTGGIAMQQNAKQEGDLSTQFIWTDDNNGQIPFRNWQIAHFRLINNSIFLPYGCLVGDTKIETENGYKEMSDIVIGDKVWTFNIVSQEKELSEVTMFMPKGVKDVHSLKTIEGEVVGTEDHKFLVDHEGNLEYRELRDLTCGDYLVRFENGSRVSTMIEKIEYVGKKQTYDFTVANSNSNFFANGFVTHNCSWLNPARRHFLMLSRMEDMMLLYRLERSIERRVYKIFVGAIDDADVQAYVQEVANNFKRTPLIDPQTGQIDLRKNLLPVHKDTPIPLLDGRTITIEELSNEIKEGKENFVYSVQDSTREVVPGRVVWCDKNYTAKELYKIILDDDTHCIMAGEHEVLMYDGSKCRADKLSVGESVMPFCKNHKGCISKYNNVKAIEIVDGCDVYCMTVMGLNGEDDRHNFALKTWNEDKSICETGIFVANCTDSDLFIPVRDPNAPNPIDTLSAAQNLTAVDDIKFVQNKLLTALQIPKSFLNFEDATGDGKNLALMDIRFTRTINRVQQAFLMELNKIASIHLFLLGFTDDLTNFSLAMNNPSTQAEQLQIENIQKKIGTLRDAVSDPGTGIPAMSMQRALREIMKWSDKEIQENFEEIRLERALAGELEKTSQIIKKTGIFDVVDKMYGEPGAKYQDGEQGGGQEGAPDGGGGGGGGMPMDMGGGDLGDLGDLGAPGAEEGGAIAGAEGEVPMDMAAGDMGGEMPMESLLLKKPILLEDKRNELSKATYRRADIYDKTLMINEEFDKMLTSLKEFGKEEEINENN